MKAATKPGILRYTAGQRANHWLTAIMFILLAASGLAFFHPAFFFLVHLLGGPTWARILHPYIGVVMFISFFIFAARIWSYNAIRPVDRQWMRQFDDVVMNRDDLLPPVGRYNAGQKVVFWVFVVAMILLLLTGLVIWRSIFGLFFPAPVQRIAVLIHAISAFVLIASVIVHIYAAIWVKGSIRSMTRGTVTRAWARHHHEAWYADVTGDRPGPRMRGDPHADPRVRPDAGPVL